MKLRRHQAIETYGLSGAKEKWVGVRGFKGKEENSKEKKRVYVW